METVLSLSRAVQKPRPAGGQAARGAGAEGSSGLTAATGDGRHTERGRAEGMASFTTAGLTAVHGEDRGGACHVRSVHHLQYRRQYHEQYHLQYQRQYHWNTIRLSHQVVPVAVPSGSAGSCIRHPYWGSARDSQAIGGHHNRARSAPQRASPLPPAAQHKATAPARAVPPLPPPQPGHRPPKSVSRAAHRQSPRTGSAHPSAHTRRPCF